MKVLFLAVACGLLAQARAQTALHSAAVDEHQTIDETTKVITQINGPTECDAGQRLACDKKMEQRPTGESVVTKTCMCIRIPTDVCTGGRTYTACGAPTECQPTCQNHAPCGDAVHACVPGCQCPAGMADTGVACLPMDQCAAHGSGTGMTQSDFWEVFHAEGNGGTVEYEFEVGSMSVQQAKEWCRTQSTCEGFVYGDAGKIKMLSSIVHASWHALAKPDGQAEHGSQQGTYVKPVCSTPMHPNHGGYVVAGGGVGARALFHCNRGFKLMGSAERVCQDKAEREASGEDWSGTTTFCEEDKCSVPPTASHATVQVDGEVATYTCDAGRSAVTDGVEGAWWSTDTEGSVKSVSIKCENNGGNMTHYPELEGRSWPARPTCVVDCGIPQLTEHVELLQSHEITNADGTKFQRPPKTTEGGVATFKCIEGAVAGDGDVTRTCGADGQWSGQPLECHETGCGEPQSIAHGDYATNGRTLYAESEMQWAPGRIAQYNCQPGFQMLGNAVSTCQENGQWTARPVCTKIKVCTHTTCKVARGSDKLTIANDAKADWHTKGGTACPEADVDITDMPCREAWQSRCDKDHPDKRPFELDAAASSASGTNQMKPIDTCHFVSVKHTRDASHAGEEYGNQHRCSMQHPCTNDDCCECLCWWDDNEAQTSV